MAKRPTTGDFRSCDALGAHFGRSGAAVRAWLKRPDWPQGIKVIPPWNAEDLPAITRFVASLQKSRNPSGRGGRYGLSEESQRADLDFRQQRARLARARADEIEGKLHRTADCQRRWLWAIQEVTAGMDNLAISLPAELRNADPVHWESIIRKRCDEIRATFSRNQPPPGRKDKSQ